MRYLIIFAFTFAFTASAENEMELKHFAKFSGNWDITVTGKLISGEKIQNMHLKGKLQNRKIYKGNFYQRKIKLQGTKFDGKADVEGIGFLYFDKEKKVIVVVEFMSDETSFAGCYKVIDENRSRPLFIDAPEVKFEGGTEIKGKEVISFMTVSFQNNLHEYNWINKKNNDVKFKIAHGEVKNQNESLKKYKHKDAQWILKGKYLYREGKEKELKFTEVIGKLMSDDVVKVQFFENGKVKIFTPEIDGGNNVIWKKTDLIKDFDKLK